MNHHEEHHEEEEAPSSKGEHPENPAEGTGPPANEELDEDKVERAKEELRRTGGN